MYSLKERTVERLSIGLAACHSGSRTFLKNFAHLTRSGSFRMRTIQAVAWINLRNRKERDEWRSDCILETEIQAIHWMDGGYKENIPHNTSLVIAITNWTHQNQHNICEYVINYRQKVHRIPCNRISHTC